MKIQIANPQSPIARANPLVLTTLAGSDCEMNDHLYADDVGAVHPLPRDMQQKIRAGLVTRIPGYCGMAVESAHAGDPLDMYCMVKDQLVLSSKAGPND